MTVDVTDGGGGSVVVGSVVVGSVVVSIKGKGISLPSLTAKKATATHKKATKKTIAAEARPFLCFIFLPPEIYYESSIAPKVKIYNGEIKYCTYGFNILIFEENGDKLKLYQTGGNVKNEN